jgi:hypothetical protein
MLQRPHSPSRAELKAARDQRHRQRLRAGKAVVALEIDGDVLGLLVRLGYLLERDASDREKIGEAAARALRSATAR